MINANMRSYNYFIYGSIDEYGQETFSTEAVGTVKMDINIASQSIQDNILYENCTYTGLTLDKNIDDTYVIEYGKQKLKVQYINPKGRYIQVFMGVMA